MRRVLMFAAASALLPAAACVTEAASSAPPALDSHSPAAQSLDSDRFAGAERLGDTELQRLLPGMRAVYIAASDEGRYRSIVSEDYSTRPGVHATRLRNRGAFNALLVTYTELETMGSFRIRGSQVCSILREEIEHCRSVFQLPDGTYAFSTYENPDSPALLVRLEPNRSSGR